MDKLTDIGVIKNIFARHGFTFSKKLGQNFIVNPSVCPRIAAMGHAEKGWGIIEIGTGIGVLTNELAKGADKVVAVEIDERLIPVLEETLADHNNVKIINADFMKLDLGRVIEENFHGLNVAVCANLPYYITSPIIMSLLEGDYPIRSITVMVQKEAGVRLCAEAGTREVGAVSIAVRYYAEPELLFNVSRGSFMPSPAVDSCVIRLNIRPERKYKAADEEFFFKVVRGAFSQRRKNLLNSLSSALECEKPIISDALEKAELPANIRPEQLKMEDFVMMSDLLGAAEIKPQ